MLKFVQPFDHFLVDIALDEYLLDCPKAKMIRELAEYRVQSLWGSRAYQRGNCKVDGASSYKLFLKFNVSL